MTTTVVARYDKGRANFVKHLQPDAVLFLRAPALLIAQALKMMEAWDRFGGPHRVHEAGRGFDDYVNYHHDCCSSPRAGMVTASEPTARPFRDKGRVSPDRSEHVSELPACAVRRYRAARLTEWHNGALLSTGHVKRST